MPILGKIIIICRLLASVKRKCVYPVQEADNTLNITESFENINLKEKKKQPENEEANSKLKNYSKNYVLCRLV